jgi:hypothetical protein
MNPIVVLQCTQGIVAFLEKNMYFRSSDRLLRVRL